MNNAFLQTEPEPVFDPKPQLRAEESKMVRIIEAVQEIEESDAWSSLKQTVFDHLLDTLEKELKEEARKPNPDTNRLNRIAGQMEWAEKYVDLSKLALRYRNQLQAIRTTLDASL